MSTKGCPSGDRFYDNIQSTGLLGETASHPLEPSDSDEFQWRKRDKEVSKGWNRVKEEEGGEGREKMDETNVKRGMEKSI